MRIDPARGAKIKKAVRRAYERALAGRDLDEYDRELVEVAIGAQATLCVCDAVFKHQALNARGRIVLADATRAVNGALSALNLRNPYRVRAN